MVIPCQCSNSRIPALTAWQDLSRCLVAHPMLQFPSLPPCQLAKQGTEYEALQPSPGLTDSFIPEGWNTPFIASVQEGGAKVPRPQSLPLTTHPSPWKRREQTLSKDPRHLLWSTYCAVGTMLGTSHGLSSNAHETPRGRNCSGRS